MDLTIKPLAPELAGDYFDFFENRAFTDGSPYRCYCQMYQITGEQAKSALENVDAADIGRASRKVAEQQIETGALQGYLAYTDGLAIGWCNANDMVNYPVGSCNGERFLLSVEKREKKRVKLVACFEIAPEFRGKGVATALLQRVADDAEAEGYIAVEGFPAVRCERFEWDCPGPVRLYEKAGFIRVFENDETMVMRYEIQKETREF